MVRKNSKNKGSAPAAASKPAAAAAASKPAAAPAPAPARDPIPPATKNPAPSPPPHAPTPQKPPATNGGGDAPAVRTSPVPRGGLPMSPTVEMDVVYPCAVEKTEEEVTFWQEDEVQKYIRENPHELSSLASTVSLGDISTTAVTTAPAVPAQPATAAAAAAGSAAAGGSPIDRAKRFIVDSLSATVLFKDAAADECRPASSSSSSSSSSTSALSRLVDHVVDVVWGREPVRTWAVLLPFKHAVLRLLSVLMYVADAVGVEAALTESTAAAAHTCVDRVFTLPTRAFEVVGTAHSVAKGLVWRAVALWWAVTVWWVLLPYRVAAYVFAAVRTVAVTLLVVFLNRAPGGHRILKALNGHVARH